REGSVDRWLRRARRADLRCGGLQDALRHRARRRRQRIARSGAQTLRFPGVNPDAGESAVPERIGGCRGCAVRSRAAKAASCIQEHMKFLCVLCVLGGLSSLSFALEREAFTITKYDLEIRLEPEQQRLGARGKITLRNDSSQPQKIAALQISSSLSWRSIRVDGKAVQYVSQAYMSDIDHTGALSEAIVTLPVEIKPKGSVGIE